MPVLLVAVLGLDAQEFKELLVFLGGVVVLYFQYLNNKAAHEAKDSASDAKTEAASTKIELADKLDRVEKNVDGKMTLLLREHGVIERAEGNKEGKAEAKAHSTALRNEVRDAVAAAVLPITPTATPPLAAPAPVVDVHVVSTAAPVPVVITEEEAKKIPKPKEGDAPTG